MIGQYLVFEAGCTFRVPLGSQGSIGRPLLAIPSRLWLSLLSLSRLPVLSLRLPLLSLGLPLLSLGFPLLLLESHPLLLGPYPIGLCVGKGLGWIWSGQVSSSSPSLGGSPYYCYFKFDQINKYYRLNQVLAE